MWKYYVYTLTDPRDGAVFYVGKGCGNRILQHEREAKRGVVSKKCDRIRDIWADGNKVIRQQMAYFQIEDDAYAHERELLDEIGRDEASRLQLTNGGRVNVPDTDIPRMVGYAIQCKMGRGVQYPDVPWRNALVREMTRNADRIIRNLAPRISRDDLERQLIKRGILLRTEDWDAIPTRAIG